ncbi:hypothetical protein III56_001907 [Salmonella enterica subsp. enterica serovar Bovismorbificans]|nr:hypothetical protein [Salmonella enterica subsp. enterica serovar Bovismorbificans]EGM9180004.1 hypothetical protein [Salmonella enterica subsp. enterica serovar Bovismorbificans]EGM9554472.1 hypothetical protein [Salmonella enterica subsp. enterica serovar Bovismorbificans]EGN0144528.1 hypothetical protein [Salmonella enterica subsp. enterica serovar Bovismorbificans]
MGSNIIELAKLGHERAAELKASCGAVDVRSLAQLISDLATQLEVQFVRSTYMAVQLANAESKCRDLAAENAHARERHVFIRALAVSILEHSGGRMDWRGAMEDATELLQTVDSVYAITPATDAFLAEMRAQGVEMAIGHIEQTICPNHETILNEFAARLRKGAAL